MATTEGGLTDISPVNLNPQAEDCYYYYYSKCTKVWWGEWGVGRRWDVGQHTPVLGFLPLSPNLNEANK